MIFAALGAIGFYVLARTRFRTSPAGSFVAAALFLFNGMYISRIAVGHLTFHPFMLTPWIAWILLIPDGPKSAGKLWRPTVAVALAGAMFAHEFHGGMVHLILPAAAAIVVILILHGHMTSHRLRPWLYLTAAVVVSVLLSGQRLVAASAFLEFFPRDRYPLQGYANILDALRFAALSVFWFPPVIGGRAALTDNVFETGRTEFDFGVGPVAALLIAAGAVAIGARYLKKGSSDPRWRRTIAMAVAVGLIYSIPVLLNFLHARLEWPPQETSLFQIQHQPHSLVGVLHTACRPGRRSRLRSPDTDGSTPMAVGDDCRGCNYCLEWYPR